MATSIEERALTRIRFLAKEIIKLGYADEICNVYESGTPATQLEPQYQNIFANEKSILKNAIYLVVEKTLGKDDARRIGLEHQRQAGRKIMQDRRQKGGRHSAYSRAQFPWEQHQLELCQKLMERRPEKYVFQKGRQKGKPNCTAIANIFQRPTKSLWGKLARNI